MGADPDAGCGPAVAVWPARRDLAIRRRLRGLRRRRCGGGRVVGKVAGGGGHARDERAAAVQLDARRTRRTPSARRDVAGFCCSWPGSRTDLGRSSGSYSMACLFLCRSRRGCPASSACGAVDERTVCG